MIEIQLVNDLEPEIHSTIGCEIGGVRMPANYSIGVSPTIRCMMPTLPAGLATVNVLFGDSLYPTNSKISVREGAIKVYAVDPSEGSVLGSEIVTVTGENLDTLGRPVCSFSCGSVYEAVNTSSTLVTCRTPQCSPRNVSLSLVYTAGVSSPPLLFSYNSHVKIISF